MWLQLHPAVSQSWDKETKSQEAVREGKGYKL